MRYHRLSELVQQDGHVDAMVAWYVEDPEEYPAAKIVIYDAIPLPAANPGQVTAAMLDEAIIARQTALDGRQAAAVPVRAEITATIGRTRVVRDGRVERHERKRR